MIMAKRNGSVKLKVGRKSMTLRFSTNAMVLFEDTHDVPFTRVMEYFERAGQGDISFKAMRALLYAGLSDEHDISLEQAGELIDEIGFAVAMEKVAEAIMLAFPEQEEPAGNGPPEGTGTG